MQTQGSKNRLKLAITLLLSVTESRQISQSVTEWDCYGCSGAFPLRSGQPVFILSRIKYMFLFCSVKSGFSQKRGFFSSGVADQLSFL